MPFLTSLVNTTWLIIFIILSCKRMQAASGMEAVDKVYTEITYLVVPLSGGR